MFLYISCFKENYGKTVHPYLSLFLVLFIIIIDNMQQKLISMQFVTILNTICFGVTIHFWLLLLDE